MKTALRVEKTKLLLLDCYNVVILLHYLAVN